MWKTLAILGLAFCIGGAVVFAQDGHSKKAGAGKNNRMFEQIFKAKDKDHGRQLSKEEFIGKVKDPSASSSWKGVSRPWMPMATAISRSTSLKPTGQSMHI